MKNRVGFVLLAFLAGMGLSLVFAVGVAYAQAGADSLGVLEPGGGVTVQDGLIGLVSFVAGWLVEFLRGQRNRKR